MACLANTDPEFKLQYHEEREREREEKLGSYMYNVPGYERFSSWT
jgi:hypothetical protein